MDPSLQKQIATVQNVLGKYVKKPPLAEKHLARPPFRFLHDILLAVMNGTGFYAGLFTPGEIDSSALTTKEEKTEFLTKVISVTGLATGSKVEAKVGKILAGQDPEKTLDFLMLLGGALERSVSSKEAVATVLGGGDKKKTDSKSKPKEKTSDGGVASKDVSKKSSKSSPAPPQAQKPSTNQKPRPAEKEKTSKSSSNSKAKSPASKTTKPDDAAKRERSRSRDASKVAEERRDSIGKDKASAPLAKNLSKEDLNRSSSKPRNPPTARSEVRATKPETEILQPASAFVSAQSLEKADSEEVVVKEEDSVQFMGEVETLLQEHGIEIEPEEKRKRSSGTRKSASAVKPSMAPETSAQVKDDLQNQAEANDNVLIAPTPPPPSKSMSTGSLTSTTKPNPITDESDVDTDDSEVGPLASTKRPTGPTRKTSETGSSDGEGSTRNAPPSAMRRPPSSFARPTSARPAPPRPKTAIAEEETVYRPPTTKIPVILDSEDVEDEESPESRKQGLLELLAAQPIPTAGSGGSPLDMASTDGRGHLVQQIMETKRELEAGDKGADDDMRGLRKQSQGDLEALKGLIQSSARLANPLARILDFLQEDIDAMTSEYVKYKTEDKKLQDLLEKEKEVTRQRLKPKRMELMEIMDKLEQQNFEIRAAHNDLQAVEEHLRNYMLSIDAGPERLDIPTRFSMKGDWEFDLDTATEEHDDLEKRAKERSGPFGEFPPFLCVSAEAREAEKHGGKGFNIPKPKRKAPQAVNPNFGRKDFKKPIFAIDGNEEVGDSERRGFFAGQGKRFSERRRSSQFLEPPEPELDSLEILSEK